MIPIKDQLMDLGISDEKAARLETMAFDMQAAGCGPADALVKGLRYAMADMVTAMSNFSPLMQRASVGWRLYSEAGKKHRRRYRHVGETFPGRSIKRRA